MQIIFKTIDQIKHKFFKFLMLFKIKLNKFQIAYHKAIFPLKAKYLEVMLRRKKILRNKLKRQTVRAYRDIYLIIYRFLLRRKLRQAIKERDPQVIISIYRKTIRYLKVKYKYVFRKRK